jgi:hypothetical protein
MIFELNGTILNICSQTLREKMQSRFAKMDSLVHFDILNVHFCSTFFQFFKMKNVVRKKEKH